MRIGLEEHLGAMLRHQPDAGLIGLSARREKERVLGADQLGDALLEPAGRGVAVEYVVADFRLGHRAPHAGGRLGDGVGAEIDRRGGRTHPRRTRCRRRMRIRSYVSATSPPSRKTNAV